MRTDFLFFQTTYVRTISRHNDGNERIITLAPAANAAQTGPAPGPAPAGPAGRLAVPRRLEVDPPANQKGRRRTGGKMRRILLPRWCWTKK